MAAVLAIGSFIVNAQITNAAPTFQITVYETCFKGNYSLALSNPTVWCTADWDPGGTFADEVRHKFIAEFISVPMQRAIAYIALTSEDDDHTIYVYCSRRQEFAYVTATATPRNLGKDEPGGSQDVIYGPIGAHPKCPSNP